MAWHASGPDRLSTQQPHAPYDWPATLRCSPCSIVGEPLGRCTLAAAVRGREPEREACMAMGPPQQHARIYPPYIKLCAHLLLVCAAASHTVRGCPAGVVRHERTALNPVSRPGNGGVRVHARGQPSPNPRRRRVLLHRPHPRGQLRMGTAVPGRWCVPAQQLHLHAWGVGGAACLSQCGACVRAGAGLVWVLLPLRMPQRERLLDLAPCQGLSWAVTGHSKRHACMGAAKRRTQRMSALSASFANSPTARGQECLPVHVVQGG